ncbi:hypothetical protein [Kitasatospora sp. NPDC059827]|uniref:hypothetical protein n=1 Tax=Kitasatospora sp. NPDC059827 TaxID=3346964 RepID=UPI0036622315
MNRFTKVSVTALVSLAASLGTLASTTSPAVASTADVCGGAVSDYTGVNSPDAAFTGTATDGATSRPFSITPQAHNSSLIKTELVTGTNDTYAIANFLLGVNSLGRGTIDFPIFGGTGGSSDIQCENGTRVTRITGLLHVMDAAKPLEFTVSRS